MKLASFKKCILLLFGLALANCTNNNTAPAVNALDAALVTITKEQANLIFETAKVFPDSTELSIALIKNGKVNFVGVQRSKDTLVYTENSNSVFEIGSITKVFTATLLADFVVEKKVELDDAIENYLDFNINTQADITFKQLANHSSGLPRLPSNLSFFTLAGDNTYKYYNSEKLKNYLTKDVDLSEKPGIHHEYSNLGVGLLGYTLAELSKTPYETLLKQCIFDTYKMSNSTSKRENIANRLVKGLNESGEVTPNWDFDALAGAGAIVSTTEDLAKFGLAQFNETNKVLKLTQTPTFVVNNTMSVGLGWLVLQRKNGTELVWHNGGTAGYSSSMALNVKQKNGVIILSNVSAFNKHAGTIDQLCFNLIKTIASN